MDEDLDRFSDPLEIVDRTDLPYERRLALLQAWQAKLASADAPEAEREAVTGAIQALEMGAEVQGDGPADVPPEAGPGVG